MAICLKGMSDSEIKKINGKTRLESVLVKKNLNGEETVLPLDGLFVAIGKEPHCLLYTSRCV